VALRSRLQSGMVGARHGMYEFAFAESQGGEKYQIKNKKNKS
jgi:hypothetical protein